ncbi:hypothetical protein VTO42DRAFT_3218 [Malbranchea cinnamomea]
MQPRRRRPPRAGALTDLPPLLIVKKIVLLQVAYYVCAAVLILFTALVAGTAFSLDLILSWHSVRGDTTVGWTLSFVWLLNSSIGVIFILILVSRSKLVLDFALTLHFIHFVITSFYTHSIPSNWLWWGLQVASAALMTFLGVWVCQWKELKPISFGGGSLSARNKANQTAEGHAGTEAGGSTMSRILRGIFGRDGGGDGSGAYEMVPVKDRADEAV